MKDIREILNQYNIPWKYGDKEEVEATVKMFNKIIEQEKESKMSNELNCMNCSIRYFKDNLCDCDNGICKEFKRIGDEGDFEKDVLARIAPRWTPITESEPTTTDHVLVTYKWNDDDYEVSEMDYWVTKYGAEHGDKWCKDQINHVVAWQEKPKPYKEKR